MNPLEQSAASTSSRLSGSHSLPSLPRPSSAQATIVERKRPSSALSKRRSVSSMKGLMPLALSPACSLSSTPTSAAEELMTSQVDGYFPEVLAKDLERSTTIFASQNMTSGPPESQLLTEEKGSTSSPGWPSRYSHPWNHQSSSGPVRLGPIQERQSVVSFQCRDEVHSDGSTDEDSLYCNEEAKGAEAPSISFRAQSVSTAATSFTSHISAPSPSPMDSPRCESRLENSWIDADSDDEDEPEPTMEHDSNVSTLSPRPPTPPFTESVHDLGAVDIQSVSSAIKAQHRKSHSICHPPIIPPRRRRSTRLSESGVAERSIRSAPPHSGRMSAGRASPTPVPRFVGRPRASSLQTNQQVARQSSQRSSTSQRSNRPSVEARPAIHPILADEDSDFELESLSGGTYRRDVPVFIRPSPPPSPLPSVQAWLNGNALPYASQCQSDDLAKAVPLPPNVIETLRVSIACFPETMLLTSSLTIETIRNYSRKVRQPSMDLMNNLAPDPVTETPRKSIWQRVVTYKRNPSCSERVRTRSPSPIDMGLKSPSATSIIAQKPWHSLKNVFGSCSDYICDALWAHLVAYNYISALIPRTPTVRSRSSESNDSMNDEIPKKAASLLGLTASQGSMMPNVDRIAQKLGVPSWALSKEGMVVTEQSARATSNENMTRDIQTGLMRCIVRLIATAQLMAEDNTAEETVVEMETKGVDMLFTRSLCEIVRMSEEFNNY